jgi:hypothetical protein
MRLLRKARDQSNQGGKKTAIRIVGGPNAFYPAL